DRADPFAARLDHVLRAIGDLHRAVGVDGRDIASREPAVLGERVAALALEVALHHPGAAHLQVAESLTVPGQLLAVAVDDAHVDSVDRAALLVLPGVALVLAELEVLGFVGAGGAERTHLGHARGVQHLYAIFVLERSDHGRWARRAADHRALERREAQVVL